MRTLLHLSRHTSYTPRVPRLSRPRLTTIPAPHYQHQPQSTTTTTQPMSQQHQPPKEWLIHIPDHPNSLDKRLSIRPTHLENIKPLIADKTVLMGGATLTGHPDDAAETPDMTGSVLLVTAASREQALALLKRDPYTVGGVWDLERATVWPFRSAIRTAL